MSTPQLKLATEYQMLPCPRCNGTGRALSPKTFSTRTMVHYSGGEGYGPVLNPGSGKPVPCPDCNGRKLVPR